MSTEKRAVESVPGNEEIIARAWVNVRGSWRVFYVYFLHSESPAGGSFEASLKYQTPHG